MSSRSLAEVQVWAFASLLALADHFDPNALELRAGVDAGITPRTLLSLYPHQPVEWAIRAAPVLAESEAVREALTTRHGTSTLLGDALMGETHSRTSQLWVALQAVDEAAYEQPAPELLEMIIIVLNVLIELREIRFMAREIDTALPYFTEAVEDLLLALRD